MLRIHQRIVLVVGFCCLSQLGLAKRVLEQLPVKINYEQLLSQPPHIQKMILTIAKTMQRSLTHWKIYKPRIPSSIFASYEPIIEQLPDNVRVLVPSKVALYALQAYLEKIELDLFYAKHKKNILIPSRDYKQFMHSFRLVLGDYLPLSHTNRYLAHESYAHKKKLKRRLYKYRKSNRALLSFNRHVKFRQTEEVRVQTFISGVQILAKFYERKLEKLLDLADAKLFWEKYDLEMHNFPGLLSVFLKDIFGKDFLKVPSNGNYLEVDSGLLLKKPLITKSRCKSI